jgi:predicted DNA-binding antitoxin AbrB/MazE fold protein
MNTVQRIAKNTEAKGLWVKGVLKPIEKLNLPEKAKVRITISGNFSKLLHDVGEIEAKEDIDQVLENMRARNYYEEHF